MSKRIELRIAETQGILDDLAAIKARITAHESYLKSPLLRIAHMNDVRDHDVVMANLTLGGALVDDATRQISIALRMAKLALPAPEPEPAPAETETPTP
jgi:hypothetical protein